MKILLLAGSGEARKLAEHLAKEPNVEAIASLSGATREPGKLPLQTRVGGFAGPEGFRNWVVEHGITAVIDATHPFAHRISKRTAEICASLNIPYLQVLRPEWRPGVGDNWTFIDHEEDASRHIPDGKTVFLATGRQTLDRFSGLVGRRLICRQIDPPDRPFPFEGGEFLVGRPPFSVSDELKLFRELKVDWLIVKNAGGDRSRTKLDAARELGIPVLMINRPPQHEGTTVSTPEDAISWLRTLT